jgi:hypothetical protein
MTPFIMMEKKDVSVQPGVRRHSRECFNCDNISMCFYRNLECLVSANHQNWLIAVSVTASFSFLYIYTIQVYFCSKQVKDKFIYWQVEPGIDFNSPPLKPACGL